MSAAEAQLVNEVARESALARVAPREAEYDAILIDCQPCWARPAVNVLTAAHASCLWKPSSSLRGVALLVDTIETRCVIASTRV